jgi:hypothetical protein
MRSFFQAIAQRRQQLSIPVRRDLHEDGAHAKGMEMVEAAGVEPL